MQLTCNNWLSVEAVLLCVWVLPVNYVHFYFKVRVGNYLSVLRAIFALTHQTFKACLKLCASLIKNQIRVYFVFIKDYQAHTVLRWSAYTWFVLNNLKLRWGRPGLNCWSWFLSFIFPLSSQLEGNVRHSQKHSCWKFNKLDCVSACQCVPLCILPILFPQRFLRIQWG